MAVILLVIVLTWSRTSTTQQETQISTKTDAIAVPNSANLGTANTTTKVASIDALVDGLRRRLEAEPNDVKGWVLLAKSYHHLQRWEDASDAFAKAKALGYEGAPMPLNDEQIKVHGKPSPHSQIPQNSADKLLFDQIKNIE